MKRTNTPKADRSPRSAPGSSVRLEKIVGNEEDLLGVLFGPHPANVVIRGGDVSFYWNVDGEVACEEGQFLVTGATGRLRIDLSLLEAVYQVDQACGVTHFEFSLQDTGLSFALFPRDACMGSGAGCSMTRGFAREACPLRAQVLDVSDSWLGEGLHENSEAWQSQVSIQEVGRFHQFSTTLISKGLAFESSFPVAHADLDGEVFRCSSADAQTVIYIHSSKFSHNSRGREIIESLIPCEESSFL